MTDPTESRLAEVLQAAEAAMVERYGPLRLAAPTALDGSPRAVVLRASVEGARDAGLPATVVVKAHDPGGRAGAAVREPAALSMLTARGFEGAPALLATSSAPALVVETDAGDADGSLADLLIGADPSAAAAGVVRWAEAIAALHVATAGAGADFEAALADHARRLGVAAPAADDSAELLAHPRDELAERLAPLGLTPDPAAIEELVGLLGMLPTDGLVAALTPADACPDNNVLRPDGAVLVDFEGATYRHLAWDAAYLTVPWPSCWCSWSLPAEVAGRGLDRWRALVGAVVPEVSTPAFDEALEIARTGWTVASTSWYLRRAVGEPAAGAGGGDGSLGLEPPARALVQHRLAAVVAIAPPALPALTRLCEQVLAATRRAWGECVLAPAPAFRGSA